MPDLEVPDVWPRMRAVVTSVVTGLGEGRFIEETLDGLCGSLRARSGSVMLGPRPSERLLHASAPSIGGPVAGATQRAIEVLGNVLQRRRTMSGRHGTTGAFIGLPLWSAPETKQLGRRLMGALYLEFGHDGEVRAATVDFLESVALLLGGVIAQQALIDESKEVLREERAKDPADQVLTLDDLLAPESMRSIREEVRAALRGQGSLMILGESGTGKTQLARAIARASKREPIVRATLGLSDDLNTITSELFGHERGAFSGAVSKRKGLVEYADGGTLILDEVLNLRPQAQQLLLDFTQFGTYRPLGYQRQEPKRADVRLISVTNGNLAQAIADTRFRQDLYFRLATVPLTLPPLRDRRWDIPEMAVRYLQRTDPQRAWKLSERARSLLMGPYLDWSGNIRELEAVMDRARNRLLSTEDAEPTIQPSHLDLPEAGDLDLPPQPASTPPPSNGEPLGMRGRWEELLQHRVALDAMEKQIIEEALEMCEGVVAKTARELSVSRTGLISRISTLEIDIDKPKSEQSP